MSGDGTVAVFDWLSGSHRIRPWQNSRNNQVCDRWEEAEVMQTLAALPSTGIYSPGIVATSRKIYSHR